MMSAYTARVRIGLVPGGVLACVLAAAALGGCSLFGPSMDCGEGLTAQQCQTAYQLALEKQHPIDSHVATVKVYLGCPVRTPAGCPAAMALEGLAVELTLDDAPEPVSVYLDRDAVQRALLPSDAP